MSVRAPVGAINVIDEPFAIGRGLCAIRPADGRSTRGFLLATLGLSGAYLESRAQGSTFTAVNKADIHELPILLPPLPEQKKIAAILSSVDDAITATRKVIEQAERLKKGLLQTLMTRGIGHRRFKKTEIGEIPEEWEVAELGSIAKVSGGKRMPKGRPFAGFRTPHPYIRVSDLRSDGTISLAELEYVKPEDQRSIRRYVVTHRDVVISIAGTIGLANIVPEELDGAQLTENAARIRPISDRVTSRWIANGLRSGIGQDQIEMLKGVGGGVPKLALFRIRAILLPIPPPAEQTAILERLIAVDDAARQQASALTKLQFLKRGLLQDLLTGRVRVTPD